MNKQVFYILILLIYSSCKEDKRDEIKFEKFNYNLFEFSMYIPENYEAKIYDYGGLTLIFNNNKNIYLKNFTLSIIPKNDFNKIEEIKKIDESILNEFLCELLIFKRNPLGVSIKNRKYYLFKREQFNFLSNETFKIYFLLIFDDKSKFVHFLTFYFEKTTPNELKKEILLKIYKSYDFKIAGKNQKTTLFPRKT